MPQPPRPRPELVVEELGTDICLYRPETDDVITLNATASDVWRLIDGQTSVEQILTALAEAYQIDQNLIDADVRRVLADLSGRGFLVGSEPA